MRNYADGPFGSESYSSSGGGDRDEGTRSPQDQVGPFRSEGTLIRMRSCPAGFDLNDRMVTGLTHIPDLAQFDLACPGER